MLSHLLSIGLSDTEARVYQALLELGVANVTEITKLSGVTRTLGYHTLQKLQIELLVDEVKTERKIKYYKARHPQQLVQYVARKQRSWERRQKEVEQLLPSLTRIYACTDKPSIRVQEGLDGLISLYEEKLQSKQEIVSILDVESWQIQDELWDWVVSYSQRRLRLGITERMLLLDTPGAREWIRTYKGSRVHSQYRWVRPELLKNFDQFGGGVDVYGSSVMMSLLHHTPPQGIIIESTVLSGIVRTLFELAWDAASPVEWKS